MTGLLQAEGNLLLFIQDAVRNPFLTAILRPLTHLGDAGIIWILLTLCMLFIPRTRKIGIFCAFGLIVSALVNNVALKNLIARTRPYEVVEGLTILIGPQLDYSFPSGHSTTAFAFAVALAIGLRSQNMWSRKERAAVFCAVLLAVLIAFSRLYVGVHYPTDVLGGIVSGILCGIVGSLIAARLVLALRKRFPGL